MTIYHLISITILFFTSFLGVYIFSTNRKEEVNRNFAFLTLSGVLWMFSNLMADISGNADQSLFWSKTTLIGSSLITYFFYRFSLFFPLKKNYKFPYHYIFLALTIIFIFLSLTDWNVSSVYLENGNFQIVTGFLYIPFLFYF